MASASVPPGGPARPLPPVSAVPPPHQGSKVALWIVVILGGCFAVLIVAALLLVRFFVHRVNIREAGNRVAIETPVGSINVNKADAHATGLPVYPGATVSTGNGGSVEINGSDTRVGLATEQYRTGDAVSKVQEWYRHKLGPEFRLETGHQDNSRRTGMHVDSGEHDVAFVDDRNDGARVVALDNGSDGTRITLLRIGKRETQ